MGFAQLQLQQTFFRTAAMTVMVWVMLMLAQAAVAIVCPPHVCENTKCPRPPVKTCRGRLSPQWSFCGCCKVCIHESGFGEPCTYSPLLGVPSASQCARGLICDPRASVCIPALWYIAHHFDGRNIKTTSRRLS
uniref:Putative cystine knot toxin n=1 Tax=Rhipicephalus microplus TaxID=6941 RepID=A0A6G5A7E0_RHIMP